MDDREERTVRMGGMRSSAIESAQNRGVDTVVVPLGATEQHGPHLPVETDSVLATAIAERVARRLGETLVAPTVPVGPSREHEAFAGTISLRQETLQRVVRDYLESLERQGYERAVVLPGHGGCFPVVGAMYPAIARELAIDVVAFTERQDYMGLLEDGLRSAGIDVDEPVTHAGASETAMMLAIDEDSVGPDRPAGHTGPVSPAALFASGIEVYDEDGVLGVPEAASAAAGRDLLETVADGIARFVRDEFETLKECASR
jgi:creatinine amidohydrolase